MRKFDSVDAYRAWVEDQQWYQTISLPSGITTDGKFRTDRREAFFEQYDFRGKRVLDVGCNSGQYCFMASRLGAREVVGVDVNAERLEQAKVLRDNENMDIDFLEKGVLEIGELDPFDIVLCVAVLKEVRDLVGAVESLRQVTGELALIETDVAKPLLYIPSLRYLLTGRLNAGLFAQARKSKRGWTLSPSVGLLECLFGKAFRITDKGPMVRYRMLEVKRKSAHE